MKHTVCSLRHSTTCSRNLRMLLLLLAPGASLQTGAKKLIAASVRLACCYNSLKHRIFALRNLCHQHYRLYGLIIAALIIVNIREKKKNKTLHYQYYSCCYYYQNVLVTKEFSCCGHNLRIWQEVSLPLILPPSHCKAITWLQRLAPPAAAEIYWLNHWVNVTSSPARPDKSVFSAYHLAANRSSLNSGTGRSIDSSIYWNIYWGTYWSIYLRAQGPGCFDW